MVVQAGRDETPGLVKQKWKTDRHSNQKRKFNISKESLRQVGVDHPVDHRAGLEERCNDKLGNLFSEEVGTDRT